MDEFGDEILDDDIPECEDCGMPVNECMCNDEGEEEIEDDEI